jgi:hypothetical protein
MKYIKILTVFMFLLTPAFAGAVDLQGDYLGNIAGGGSESTTSFKTEGNKISATYYMSKVKSSGTLTDIKLNDRSLTGQWHDDFGKGYVLFQFNPDYSSFQGCWDKKKLKDCENSSQPWNGNKAK